MKRSILTITTMAIFLTALTLNAEGRKVVGWLEMVRVYPGNLIMRAKLDTGAKSSSINVYNLKKFERNGETWVSFELKERRKDQKGKNLTFEKKVIDSVKIKKKGGGLDKRIVVRMDICIAGIRQEIEMSLLDRSNFNNQVLIGRTDLFEHFIIDPSKVFTHKPDCKIPVQLTPQKPG
jgi:hypothetical protein